MDINSSFVTMPPTGYLYGIPLGTTELQIAHAWHGVTLLEYRGTSDIPRTHSNYSSDGAGSSVSRDHRLSSSTSPHRADPVRVSSRSKDLANNARPAMTGSKLPRSGAVARHPSPRAPLSKVARASPRVILGPRRIETCK